MFSGLINQEGSWATVTCQGPDVFDYSQDFAAIDFRNGPDRYRIGKGEQGVLLVEPDKGELLPHWSFKTEDTAKVSSSRIYGMWK